VVANSRTATAELQACIERLTLGGVEDRAATIRLLVRGLLAAVDPDPLRVGLTETPDRVTRAWLEFLSPATNRLDTAFEAVQTDQLIVLQGHRVWSMCEHHLLPFWCDLTIGYLPEAHVLGVSKLARIANLYAARLQLQERLVHDIGQHVARATVPPTALVVNPHVAVLGRGEHLCMTMRGVRSGAHLVTSYLTGHFRDNAALRAEFFALANGHA
jgi:GTP cyclohydrolase I